MRLPSMHVPSLAALLLLSTACSLPKDRGIRLGIPFRSQEVYNYCGATTVLMWRLFHGLPEISQQTIFNWMLGSACGSNQLGIQGAVRHFTRTSDAYWDFDRPEEYRGLISRQVASMDARVPVIAVVRQDHTVILNGGKWHQEGSFNVWDFVYYHDPADSLGSNEELSATDWLFFFCPGYSLYCDQIVSSSAVAPWFLHLQTYGDTVVPRGGGFNPDGSWPPAY